MNYFITVTTDYNQRIYSSKFFAKSKREAILRAKDIYAYELDTVVSAIRILTVVEGK